MKPNTAAEKYVVLVSAERPGMALETLGRACRQMEAELDKRGFAYQQVMGKYKGKVETSFAVVVPSLDDAKWLVKLGRDFNQESILLLMPAGERTQRRKALLVNLDPALEADKLLSVEPIGTWEAVSEMEARASEGFTYNPVTQTFYTVTQRPIESRA